MSEPEANDKDNGGVVRVTVGIGRPNYNDLVAIKKRSGCSISNLISLAVDQYLHPPIPVEKDEEDEHADKP